MNNQNDPVNTHPFTERTFEIPQYYGDNKVVLMVRDPWTVYSYWEIKKEVEENVRAAIKSKGLEASKSVLRMYRASGPESDPVLDMANEFELRGWATSWYIHVDETGNEWVAEVGIVCSSGEFFCLARSNRVRTPANVMSEVCDGEWMCPEELYYKMFAASGGHDVGQSSMELKEYMERHLKKWLSSGGVTSGMFSSFDVFKKKK
jgi:uncharacterized protein